MAEQRPPERQEVKIELRPGGGPGGRGGMNARINREKPKNLGKTISRLLRYSGKSSWILLFLIVATVIVTVSDVLSPMFQQLAIDDLLLLGDQQDEVLGAQVELGIAVELQAVELGVHAVAEAELEGHAAVEGGADLLGVGGLVQGLDAGLVDHGVGAGGLGQGGQDALHRVALDHTAIGTERLVKNGKNLHDDFLLKIAMYPNV